MTIPVPNQGTAHGNAGQGSIEGGYLYVEASDNYLNIGLYGEGRGTFTLAESSYVTFIINRPATMPSDNNAPRAELASAVDESYITAGNIGNYAQGELIGSIGQIAGAPVLSNNHVDLTAGATRKGSIDVDEVGVDNKYAKKVQLNINEINADGGNASVTQATYYAGLAGITVGGNELSPTLYPTSAQGAVQNGAFSYGGGSDNGYFVWKVNDQGRTSGTLTLYFNDNVENLDIKVADSGGTALTLTVTVDGIKTGGDDLTGSASITDGTRMTNENSASFDGLTWEWDDLTPVFANMGSGANAQIWFYAVQRFDSPAEAAGADALFSATEGNSGITPIGFTDADGRWTAAGNSGFDFTTGLLYGVAPVNGGSATGSGYYRFEFYPMNYAGYIGKPVVRLVKADVGIAEPDVTLSYNTSSESGNPLVAGTQNDGHILDDQLAYISTDLTVTIAFAGNRSGNKVSVMGADGENYIFLIGYNGGIKGVYTVSNNTLDRSDKWGADYSMTAGGVFDKVVVSASVADADGTMTVKAVYTAPANKITEKTHVFAIYTNADDTSGQAMANCLSDYDTDWEGWTTGDDVSGNGTRLWFDHIGIDDVTFGDEYAGETTGVIPAGDARNWFTNEWAYGGDLTISTTDEYQYIFYKLAYYTQDFGNAQSKTGEYYDIYDEFGSNAYFESTGVEVMAAGGWKLLDSGVTSIEFNNITKNQAGYYVVYVITADRASHFDFTAFGVLVDATDYEIRAEYDAETLSVLGDIDPFGLNEIGEQTLKRGGLYTFKPQLKDEYIVAGAHMYVPYQVKKAVWDDATSGYNYVYIYSHVANDRTGEFKKDYLRANYLYASIAADGDGIGIGLDLDVDRNSVTQLPAANGQTAIVFSFRQVVNVSFDNAAQYTGEHIDIQVNAYDLNGGQVNIEGNEPYVLKYQGTGAYEGVTNAGSYEFLLDYKSTDFDIDSYLEHSQYYVLAATPTVTLNVSKVELSLNAKLNPGTLYYGDVTGDNAVEKLGLSYEITGGLVGQDGQDGGKTFDELTGKSVVASVVGASSGVYLDAGSHNVTVAFSTTNYNVSVNWTTDQVMQIAKRELAFTVDSPENVTYGNAMPSSYTVRMDKSVFDFDTLSEYQTAGDVGNMLGVTVTEEGEQWVFSFNADAFAAFTPGVNGKGYYNVGDYAITGFDVEKTGVNNNFAPTQTGESKVTVVARVVTVSPQLPGVVNVESLDELNDGRTFPIATEGNPDVTAFGISGNFGVGEQESVVVPGTEYTYFITGDVSTFTSDHNTADVTNVEIVFDTSAWTFKVVIITAAGQFVIEFTDAGIFTVTYGELFDAAAIAANAGGTYYTVLYYPKEGEGYATESTAIPDGVNLNVTITAAGYQADLYANHAGNYNLTVSAEAQDAAEGVFYTYAYKTADGAALPSYVTVETLQATVKVSEVTALSKPYGANDPTINPDALFTFAFTSGAHQDLLDAFIAENGTISVRGIGTTWNRTASVGLYDYNWNNCTFYTDAGDIASGDIRFEIAGIEDVKFEITPKVLDFNALVGSGILVTAAGKGYDGDTTAEGASLSFASGDTIVVAGEVALGYDANYWNGTGYVAEVGSGYAVRFANIVLTGAGVNNYTLVIADEAEGYGFYFDYNGTDEKGFGISPEAVTFLTTFFSVSKTFDGGTGMEQGNIAFNPGTGFEAFGNGWSLVEGKFDSANAGEGILVTFTILCPEVVYPNLTDPVYNKIEYYYIMPEGLALTPVNGQGEKGVYIEVTGNVTGKIEQFTLRSTHINFTFEPAGRTKVYDGDGVFDVPFEFNDTIKGLLVEGFDFGSIGLEFAGETDKNVGDHAMKITGVNITDTTNFRLGRTLNGTDVGEGGTATGKDYATIEGMINGTTGGKPFSITPKTLTFDVAFEGVNVYAGLETLSATTPATIYGVIDGEELNIATSTYTYARAAAEGGYKTFVYVQAERFDEASGNYYHDVLITITVSTGNGFDWNNYTLEGLNKVDGKDNEFTVFREGAAILNPKQVTINLSEISVKDGGKVYDATTDIELIFPEKVYAEQFFESDLAKLDFTYTAALDSANVGTRNVNISDIKPVLKEANAAETHILDSYSIKFSGSFTKTAVVDPVEVTVEFTIPDKTYDGTRFVNMSAAEGSLVAPENSGRDTWYVAAEQFVNNYYVSVVAAYYDDVNVVRDSGNNPDYKNGKVIGFELVCTQGTSNYVLVGVEGEEKGVLYNLYSFPAGTDISSAYEYIEGVVTEGRNTYYLVRENNTAAQAVIDALHGELYATRTYNTAAATGRILPAQIDFEIEITNPDAFTKAFDDTTALVTEPTLGTDYRIIVEQIGDDEITGITVSFSGAAVGRQDVIFAVSQTAESNPNYSFNAGDSYTVRGGGYIKKFGGTINAELVSEEGGITATYGTADLSYTVRYYYMSDTKVDIIVDAEGNAYVTLDGWKAMFGHDDDDLTADVMARRYTNANGEWQQSNVGDHIRITGKFGTPTLLTAEGGDKFVDKDGLVCVNVGIYSNVHLDVKADSFNVGIASGSETVTVNAKDLRVYVTNAGEGGNFTADYFVGKLPVPGFGLYMNGDVDDLAAFDSWTAVRTTLRGQFMNGETPLTSTDVPTGNYPLKVTTTTGNYNVIIVTEAGETAEHKLVITIPELDTTQYKVKTNLKRQYELGADGQGVALGASDLLNATAVADGNNNISIIWKDANGSEIPAPSDVGTYNWELTVTKKIGGTQEAYTYAGEFTANGSFTIAQRKITVSLKESVGFTYDDGKAHVITKEDLTAKDADGNADEFIALISDTITYLLNGTSCTDMTNAGGYTVVLEFVDSPNYELVNNVGTVYVKAKPITVKVDPASKVYDATNGINGNVGISFTAEGADASDFSVVYRSAGNVVGAITTPGIYTYTIVSKDPNYTVSGESTGNFNVQISKVTYTKDDVDYVTIAFGSPVAVNYYLNDTAVAQGSGYWNIVDANVQKLAGEDGGLVTNGIIRIEMSNNNGVVSTVPGGVTVTARIPAGVGSDFTLYRVTSSGGLEVVEDYTVANGVVTYTTDYISNLVFVGTAPVAGFPWWIIPIIAAALVLTLALAILIAVLVKLHRAPDPIPVEVTPIDSIMPEPPVPAPAAPVAPVIVEVPAADIAPTVYDAPAAVSKHRQPPIIGIR